MKRTQSISRSARNRNEVCLLAVGECETSHHRLVDCGGKDVGRGGLIRIGFDRDRAGGRRRGVVLHFSFDIGGRSAGAISLGRRALLRLRRELDAGGGEHGKGVLIGGVILQMALRIGVVRRATRAGVGLGDVVVVVGDVAIPSAHGGWSAGERSAEGRQAGRQAADAHHPLQSPPNARAAASEGGVCGGLLSGAYDERAKA